MTTIGMTKDAGWQAGVRRTVRVDPAEAWSLLTSAEGQELWLGAVTELSRGAAYELPDGTRGEIRALSGSHLRMTWDAPGWAGESTIQLRAIPAKTGTTISFHHERLADAEERHRALVRWRAALDEIEQRLLPTA
jgi:uncharacterized protein YndB with AHSA1/START domain